MYRTVLSAMTGGWFVGNFEPTAFRTRHVEVAWKEHVQGETYEEHYQRNAWEINLLIRGRLQIGTELFGPRDIFVVEPLERVKPVFLEDCLLVVVKTPSLPQDKIVVVPPAGPPQDGSAA